MMNLSAQKTVEDNRFLSTPNTPIYIELPNEKFNSLSPELNTRKA